MSYRNVGKVWTPATLAETLERYQRPTWCDAVTLHHTASPNLSQRPRGWTVQHMRNLQHFYQNTLGWSAGPHFFTDEDQIMGLSPFTARGVHAVSFNRRAIGIEVLGDYDQESPKRGRGLECWKLAAQTTAVLLHWMGKRPSERTVLFHRDDPRTSKTCPGRKVKKDWVLQLIADAGPPDPIRIPTSDEREEKPEVPGWTRFTEIDGRWFVPFHDFLVHLGGDSASIITKMKSRSGKFYYDGDLVEGAFYDRQRQTTMAPAREVLHFA